MNFVTDTHALLWWFIDSPRISFKAAEIFHRCDQGENVIFIPSIVVAEAMSIFDKKRMVFDFKKLFKKIANSENYVIVALDLPVLREMVELKNISELHDKIIVSTAKHLKIPLITKDNVIQNVAAVKTIW